LVEVHSAICRLHRDKEMSDLHKQGAVARLRLLNRGWREILPDDQVRDLAAQLLGTHSLRAADSLQLAASLINLVRAASVQKELHLRGPAIGQGRRFSRFSNSQELSPERNIAPYLYQFLQSSNITARIGALALQRSCISSRETNDLNTDKGEVGGSSPPRPTITITNNYAAILTFPLPGISPETRFVNHLSTLRLVEWNYSQGLRPFG
jgi:hypothetical protein